MPADYSCITASIFFVLALTSFVDLLTATIPDILIFLGLLAVTVARGLGHSWEDSAHHLRQAIGAGLVIWVINFLWYKKFRHDALGMGDAKWTMLAVDCFGILPALIAWGVGSVLAVVFIGVAKIFKRPIARVHFAPFLFAGLCAGIYWQFKM